MIRHFFEKNWLLIASGITVIIIFHFVYGLEIIIPTNISWLMTVHHDWGAHYLGWYFYRNEPWYFPLGEIHKLFYPIGTNVGFTDSIPLFAIFFKLFAVFLPEDFQYFGIWLFSCYLLTAYFTTKLFLLLKVNKILTFIAIIFLITNPVFIYRGMHPSLCAHWLIIASIYIYCLDSKTISTKKILSYQLILLLLSGLINPYLCLMVLGFTVALSVKLSFIDKVLDKKNLFLYNTVSLITLFLVWFFIGMVGFNFNESLSVAGSYGLYSLNLNSLYNSWGWSYYLPGLKNVSWHQYEGFMYLGLGMLLLLFLIFLYLLYSFLLNLIWKKPVQLLLPLHKKWLVPLIIMASLFTIFAITHVVSINDHILFKVKLPGIIVKLGETFRSSGRFFWISYYLIIFFAIISIARVRIPIIAKICVLTIILFIQLKDTWRLLNMYNLTYGAYETPLDNNTWQNLIKEYDEINLYPPFEGSYRTKLDYQYFCFLAGKQRKPINTGYVSRLNYRLMNKYSDSLQNSIEIGKLKPQTLYITTASNLKYFSYLFQSNDWGFSTLDNYYFFYYKNSKNKPLQSLITPINEKNKVHLDSVANVFGKKTFFAENIRIEHTSQSSIAYFIEKFNATENYVSLTGWAFIENTNNNKGDSIFFTMTNENKTYITNTVIQQRTDITNHYKKEYLNDAGFYTRAFTDSMEKGNYQLGIVIKNVQGTIIHQLTDRFVKVGLKENAEPEKITSLPPTGKIIYNFDLFENNSSDITLGGWATIENQSADGQIISFVFKNEKDIYKFEAEPVKRPDVTAYFKNKYKLDNSGFSVKVLKNSFDKGKYEVGIIIKDPSNKEVYMITNKVIEIQ